uniref:K Homology domain-containing protein n=1 Tax=Ditylenchus dipsaci TaxID=166011 RepID=A0A915EIS1_9BILA
MQRPIRLKSQIFVPDSVVGVLIGVKGSNIKNMIFATGASIRIDGKRIPKVQNDTIREGSENVLSQSPLKPSVKDDDANSKKSLRESGKKADGRFVAISGYDFQVYKVSSVLGFQAVAETKNICLEELVLTAETMVPSTIVGRIIGREGRNIKELRRLVQAIIYIVESHDVRENSLLDETSVRIAGNVFCLQTVQMHFARLLAEIEQVEPCCPFYLNPSPDFYCPPVDAFMNPYFSTTSLPMQRPIRLKSQIFVPDSVVGVLIGVKGSNIKNMIFATGASIRIDGKRIPKVQNDTIREGSENVLSQSPLKPSVKDDDANIYKAQSWVFQAVAETKNICLEELVLTAETMVPSTIVGRIIGREGRNIKELRRLVQAIIYIVESHDVRENSLLDETSVRIAGNVLLANCSDALC